VREQVELYESSGGTKAPPYVIRAARGYRDPHGNKTGAIRKTPLMRVKDRNNYVLIGSVGGAPNDPVCAQSARQSRCGNRDETVVSPMRVREVKDEGERSRLWRLL